MIFANDSMLIRSRNQSPPDNQIWYYAPEKVTLYSETGVKSHTFSGGKGVITYSSAVTTVPTTLRGVTTVTDVQFPSTVTRIDRYAFRGCTSLALKKLPPTVTIISYSAFDECTNLAIKKLPDGLTAIGSYVFRYCRNLALTELPSGIRDIWGNAFYGCTGLTSITFLGTPTNLADEPFKGCTNLKDIYVPWAEGDIAGAPWGATNATVHYTESGGGAISFPESFSVTDCSGNGAATGAYTKTAETTTVNGTNYPVYSMTQELLGTTFYIYVCGYRQGSAGIFWALKADSYSASDDSYGALGSCAAGTDGLPQSTSWSSASSDATVSW